MQAFLRTNNRGDVDGLIIDDHLFSIQEVWESEELHELYHELLQEETVKRGRKQYETLRQTI